VVLASCEFLSHAADGAHLAQGCDFAGHGQVGSHGSIDGRRNEGGKKTDTGGGTVLWSGAHWHVQVVAILIEIFEALRLLEEVEGCQLHNLCRLSEDLTEATGMCKATLLGLFGLLALWSRLSVQFLDKLDFQN